MNTAETCNFGVNSQLRLNFS